ncbi:MAG: chromate resistance protein ChrB domain-containing protein [Promethearchaeota archaeon]
MLWVTRDHVHVDRVVSPWLIKRFVDKQAQFIFLSRNEIPDFVAKTGAIPFDTGTGIELGHHECNGEKHCTFDAIVEKYKLEGDKALEKVRELVRAADTGGLDRLPQAWALELVAVGAPLMVESDHEALEKEFPFYDAIYTYFQYQIIREKFKEDLEKLKTRGERRAFIRQKIKELK